MILSTRSKTIRQKAVWGPDPGRRKAVWGPGPDRRKVDWTPHRILVLACLLAFAAVGTAAAANNATQNQSNQTSSRHSRRADRVKPGQANNQVGNDKVDEETTRRTKGARRTDKVTLIVMQEQGADLPAEFKIYVRRHFNVINAYQLDNVPAGLVSKIAAGASTHRIDYNRAAKKHDALSSYAISANAVDAAHLISQQLYPYTGSGVKVAVIDSGFSSYPRQDLTDDRIAFVNFVDSDQTRHDGDGHGTHVAGIVGGTGNINRKYAGMAPGTSIVSLKVLNDKGVGTIADIIAALDWVYNHPEASIRVVNMSVGAPVTQSFLTDPLTLATKALVDRGITVVAAAGNFGKNAQGELQWGGITSPGIAPWVLTVCAFSTMGTYDTSDDVMAGFSSSGPTAVDFTAKPDICAPGVGIVSLSDPASTLYNLGALALPPWLIGGDASGYAVAPYESFSGTSMATPFVSGAVALMLEANPNLTPNLVKGILEYTAHSQAGVSPLRQGAGFMDVAGAVGLAAAYASLPQTTSISREASKVGATNVGNRVVSATSVGNGVVTPTAKIAMPRSWSKHVIWGNHMLSGGILDPYANAWALGTRWGAAQVDNGDNIVWGTTCGAVTCDNIVWGVASDGDNIVWGTATPLDNIVWGTATPLDNIVWGTATPFDNIVWGTATPLDNIVWGTSITVDNIVWGTAFGSDNIVWGTDCGGADCNVIWGSADPSDNIVWGTAFPGDNIVWGTAGTDLDNIVWGTAFDADNIVWGTAFIDNIVWGTAAAQDNVVWPVSR